MDGISPCSTTIVSKTYTSVLSLYSTSSEKRYAGCIWRSAQTRLFDMLFGELINTRSICERCHEDFQISEPFMEISLPIILDEEYLENEEGSSPWLTDLILLSHPLHPLRAHDGVFVRNLFKNVQARRA